MTTNPFSTGESDLPDVWGGVALFALLADGATLCERCIVDPTNPVEDWRDKSDTSGGCGWEIVGFFTSDQTDEDIVCDHCNATLDKPTHED